MRDTTHQNLGVIRSRFLDSNELLLLYDNARLDVYETTVQICLAYTLRLFLIIHIDQTFLDSLLLFLNT